MRIGVLCGLMSVVAGCGSALGLSTSVDGAGDAATMVVDQPRVDDRGSVGMDSSSADVPVAVDVVDASSSVDVVDARVAEVSVDVPTAVDVPVDVRVASCPAGMVLIPAGSFMMGDADTLSADAQPPHRVTLSAFCLDLTEVTVAAWRGCTAAGCTAPDSGSMCNWTASAGARESHPINCVSWSQARSYCLSRGADLPTEAQWEYAARGSDTTNHIFPWGNAAPGAQLCWSGGGTTRKSTCPVQSFPSGNSPFGVFDMAGNVAEWTLDWAGPYSAEPATDPTGPVVGEYRSYRGGSWNFSAASMIRTPYRLADDPLYRFGWFGIRCALAPN